MSIMNIVSEKTQWRLIRGQFFFYFFPLGVERFCRGGYRLVTEIFSFRAEWRNDTKSKRGD